MPSGSLDKKSVSASLPSEGGCYCIHFETRLGHAGHYKGWAKNSIASRILDHALTVCTPPDDEGSPWSKDGEGSKILGVLNFLGIKWHVSRVWIGEGHEFENRLKNMGRGLGYVCPDCSGARAYNRMRGRNDY